LSDPRVKINYDDAATTTHFADKFDIITSDPIHPWVKGRHTLLEEYLNVQTAFESRWRDYAVGPLYEVIRRR